LALLETIVGKKRKKPTSKVQEVHHLARRTVFPRFEVRTGLVFFSKNAVTRKFGGLSNKHGEFMEVVDTR